MTMAQDWQVGMSPNYRVPVVREPSAEDTQELDVSQPFLMLNNRTPEELYARLEYLEGLPELDQEQAQEAISLGFKMYVQFCAMRRQKREATAAIGKMLAKL